MLVDDMFETMREGGGVGLAAPQIGIALRIIVLEFAGGDDAPGELPVPPTALINPIITREVGWGIGREGCFSVPGYIGMVGRYTEIDYVAQDIYGHKFSRTVMGLHARIIQHEIDHLNGILYTDLAVEVTPYERNTNRTE